jgi:hypothetical protein
VDRHPSPPKPENVEKRSSVEERVFVEEREGLTGKSDDL